MEVNVALETHGGMPLFRVRGYILHPKRNEKGELLVMNKYEAAQIARREVVAKGGRIGTMGMVERVVTRESVVWIYEAVICDFPETREAGPWIPES